MPVRRRSTCALIAFVGLAIAGAEARASVFTFTYTRGMPGMPGQNSSAGSIESYTTTFDTITKALSFSATFGPVPGHASSGLVTKGFWLVLDDGPDPNGHPGELAIFYFDASNMGAPLLTVYGYNGVNASNSWLDGNPSVSGNQPGDLIKGASSNSTLLAPWGAVDTTTPGGPRRTLSFSINASSIISHHPLYPSAHDPWKGTGFDDSLGVWFHPTKSFTAAYNASTGGLRSLSIGTQGYMDASCICTHKIPTPGALVLLGLGGVMAVQRRR